MQIYYVATCLIILVFAAVGTMNPHILVPGTYMRGGSLNMPVGKDVTLYYAPWCGYCKEIMPEWQKVETAMRNDPSTRLTAVNCEENPHLAQREGVKGYPTIILETRGEKKRYSGNRKANDILSFIKSA